MNIVTPRWVFPTPFFYPHTLKRFCWPRKRIGSAFINGLSPYRGVLARKAVLRRPDFQWYGFRLACFGTDADVDVLLTEYCQYAYGKACCRGRFSSLLASVGKICTRPISLSELDYIHQVRYPLPVVAKMKSLLAQALADARMPEAARRIAYMTDTIYSRFFEESETYQKRSGILPVYECLPTSIAPVLDGNPGDEVWRDAVPVELVRYRFGDKSPRRSTVKMIHNKGKLYFLAEFLLRSRR